jgi:hypothetical protein
MTIKVRITRKLLDEVRADLSRPHPFAGERAIEAESVSVVGFPTKIFGGTGLSQAATSNADSCFRSSSAGSLSKSHQLDVGRTIPKSS